VSRSNLDVGGGNITKEQNAYFCDSDDIMSLRPSHHAVKDQWITSIIRLSLVDLGRGRKFALRVSRAGWAKL
jgi:hypothetical protein